MKFKAEVVGFDLSEKMVAHAAGRAKNFGLSHLVSFRKGDVHKMPFGKGSFDASISECSLCLFRDKIQVIQNMAHVVKSGKKVAVSDVITKGEIPKELHNSSPLCLLPSRRTTSEVDDGYLHKSGIEECRGL